MDGDRIRLAQFPPIPDMDDCLYDAVAVVVDEAQRAALVGDRQRELVVVDEANFLDLGRVIDIV